jgi:hypothetical protein
MEQQRSLVDYAQSLDISAASLLAIITAQLDQVEPDALHRLADLYQQSRETLRDHVAVSPPQESFAAWLKRNMEGISQHALRTRAQLDFKTLKQFLNGNMLPDSDQAERLARALYIDRTEVARVVTATMIHQAVAKHLIDTTGVRVDQVLPSRTITEEQGTIRSLHARRQKGTSSTEHTSAEGTGTNGATKTNDTAREPRTEPKADKARHPVARRQAGTKTIGPPSHPTTTSPIEAAPSAESKHATQPAADRHAGTATAVASERTTISTSGVMMHRDNLTELATGSDGVSAFKVSAQRSTRGQRRSATAAKPGATNVTAPVIGAREEEALASQDAVKGDPASDSSPVAMAAPGVVAPPAELVMETGEPVPPDRNSPARSTSKATVAPRTKAIPATSTPRPAPSTASTTAALAPTSAMLPAVHADDTMTLQLTVDEVRLIRHWRQLHPHGRRATLHYIGSLLVED